MGQPGRSTSGGWRWPLALAVLSLTVNVSFALVAGIPRPAFHDEFSYLLAADTFAHGRLANPPHPFWEHFESIHVIQQPVYASKYPPAQGAFLALGQVLAGLPILGIWLATALACSLSPWALRGWLGGRWANAGALVLTFHPLLLRWSQNYWGGVAGMLGGILLLGAGMRLARRPRGGEAVAAALGIGLLANSRPYEGFVLTVLMGLTVAVFWTRRRTWRFAMTRAALPMSAVLLPVLGWMGFYHYRVTGEPFLMPYVVHERQYAMAPSFIIHGERPEPAYRHEAVRDFFVGWTLPVFREQQTPGGFARATGGKFWLLGKEYLAWGALVPPLLVLPWSLRRPRVAVAAGLVVMSLLAMVPSVWLLSHYVAPSFFLLAVLLAGGLGWWWRRPRRFPWIGRGVVALVALALLAAWGAEFQSLSLRGSNPRAFVSSRSRVSDHVTAASPRNLVIVAYEGPKLPHLEWVYNGADIDRAPIVWARDMGADRNAALIRHFKEHAPWRLVVRGPEVELRRY